MPEAPELLLHAIVIGTNTIYGIGLYLAAATLSLAGQ